MFVNLYLQEGAVNGEHIWVDSNASGDFCYVGESDCSVSIVIPAQPIKFITYPKKLRDILSM